MAYSTQQGPLSTGFTGLHHLDVEINWNNRWVSLNDKLRYQLHPNGFGKYQLTKRRKKVTSDFFSGEYTVSEAEDNVARQLSLWVRGDSFLELKENIDLLIVMFGQSPFTIRTRTNELSTVQTSSGSADIMIDSSHVYLHNKMALAELTYSTLPGETLEMIL